jgi:hypothetical protein
VKPPLGLGVACRMIARIQSVILEAAFGLWAVDHPGAGGAADTTAESRSAVVALDEICRQAQGDVAAA